MYKTRLASKEIFSPSNKINREVSRAKDLSAPFIIFHASRQTLYSSLNSILSLTNSSYKPKYCLF